MAEPRRTNLSHDQETPRSWLLDRPLTGFALPSGALGRLMGWVMTRDLSEQREVLAVAAPEPGQRVLEVGHGPGALLAMIAGSGCQVVGVEPSKPMRAAARRRVRAALAAGRAELRAGTAERTGLPDASVDLALSVNNVPMWSDLDAGFAELHRVLRPGGRLVVAWHGGRRPARVARRLALPEDVLARIEAAMRDRFGDGRRRQLEHVVVFEATR